MQAVNSEGTARVWCSFPCILGQAVNLARRDDIGVVPWVARVMGHAALCLGEQQNGDWRPPALNCLVKVSSKPIFSLPSLP